MPTKIAGQDEATKLYESALSPRAAALLELERYVEGTQYTGMLDWFADAPMQDRAPCIVYPVVRAAIDSNTDLLLGDGKRPQLTARPDEDDSALGVEGLSEDESELYDQWLRAVERETRLWTVAREAFRQAQCARSSATVWGLRGGRLFGNVLRARWCEPEFSADGETVTRLVQCYPYVDTERAPDGSLRSVARFFRRVIDATTDTTYFPIAIPDGGRMPADGAWVADPARTMAHGLGFCPVTWYAHMRGPLVRGDYDGNALHEHLLPQVRAHDYALSQRHRAALYASDPQWTEIGVEEGYNPSPAGPTVPRDGVASTLKGGRPTTDNPITGSYRTPQRASGGRRRGVTSVWTYPDPNTKVMMHTLPGEALAAATGNANDLRVKLCESLAVVFLDPESVKFVATLSGKALEVIRRRQLDRCDQYREDFGEHWIKPSVGMLARIVQATAAHGGGVLTPGAAKVLPLLARFVPAAAAPVAA